MYISLSQAGAVFDAVGAVTMAASLVQSNESLIRSLFCGQNIFQPRDVVAMVASRTDCGYGLSALFVGFVLQIAAPLITDDLANLQLSVGVLGLLIISACAYLLSRNLIIAAHTAAINDEFQRRQDAIARAK